MQRYFFLFAFFAVKILYEAGFDSLYHLVSCLLRTRSDSSESSNLYRDTGCIQTNIYIYPAIANTHIYTYPTDANIHA